MPQEELEKTLHLHELEAQYERQEYRELLHEMTLKERRRRGLTLYPLRVKDETLGPGQRLVFELEGDLPAVHAFGSGKPAALFSNVHSDGNNPPAVTGVVLAGRDTIRFMPDAEAPDWLDDDPLGLELVPDDRTCREMQRAIRAMLEASRGPRARLRDILLGAEVPRFEAVDFTCPELNVSQNEAVARILSARDLALIHGPPGTGKTTTLVRAIVATLEQGERQVLACAASNTAVDLLAEKLALSDVKVLRIGHPARVTPELFEYTLEGRIRAHENYKVLNDVRREALALRGRALKYKRNYDRKQKMDRREKMTNYRNLMRQARDIEKSIVRNIFADTQVVTGTLTGLRELKDRIFSTVFIDEAAQALEGATWLGVLHAERVVLAGDHLQLPPVIKSQEAARQGLAKTLFEKCIQRVPTSAVMLGTQYRMHAQIMSFSNQEFYENRLVADESVRDALLERLSGPDGLPFEFVDTAGCDYNEKEHEETTSLSNPEEAELLCKHLVELYADLSAEIPFSIGVITPYSAQVKVLRELLRELPVFANRQINVHTVDGFQGRECDIIYISLVRSNETGEIGFLKDVRRMNVALTRARRKLAVFGDSATVTRFEFYDRFVAHAQQLGALRSAYEFM